MGRGDSQGIIGKVGDFWCGNISSPLTAIIRLVCSSMLAFCIGNTPDLFQVPGTNLLADAPNPSPVGKSKNVIIILGCVLTLLLNVEK